MCGFTHEGSLDNCNQISEPVKSQIKKLVKDGVFNGTCGNAAMTTAARKPTKHKRGTVNAVVEEEDDREETEVKEDGMPTQEHLLQMLGMLNTLIGNVNSTDEPTTKASGCWNGDTLANLGFTNLQTGGTGRDAGHGVKKQGVSFAEAEWKVQGVCGTNPLKVKKKSGLQSSQMTWQKRLRLRWLKSLCSERTA